MEVLHRVRCFWNIQEVKDLEPPKYESAVQLTGQSQGVMDIGSHTGQLNGIKTILTLLILSYSILSHIITNLTRYKLSLIEL